MMNTLTSKDKIDLTSIFLVLTVFTKEIFNIGFSGLMIDLFAYTFFTLYFLLRFKNLFISSKYIVVLFFWALTSIISSMWFDFDILLIIKQLVPISIIMLACYDILYKRKFILIAIFNFYVKLSYYSAIFGIVQWSLSLYEINILIKVPGLLDSIAYEPSHYATIIIPAAVYSIMINGLLNRKSLILILSLILTFSLTSYMVLILTLLIPKLRLRSFLIIVIAFFIISNLLQYVPERIKERIDSIELFSNTLDYKDPSTNLSVVSLASNLDVAMYSIKNNPLFGAGIGGHQGMYDKFYENSSFRSHPWYKINYNSAHSLSIRILSEAGIVGFFAFLFFLFRSYIPENLSNKMLNDFHIISLCCLSHFICKTFKLGGYFDYGTPFFFTILLLNLFMYKRYVKN
jgi:O-antigen ligase